MTRPLLITVCAFTLFGCQPEKKPAPEAHATPPASIKQISAELELATVRLSAKAEKRLGVTVAEVKHKSLRPRRVYPGVVVLPPQNQTQIQAPLAGTLHYLGGSELAVGSTVRKGEPLFSLTPVQTQGDFVLGPAQLDQLNASRIAVEQSSAAISSRISVARAELTAAQIEVDRSQQLFDQKVGSRKRLDDAIARRNIAQETITAAQGEQKTLRTVDQVPQRSWSPTVLTQDSPLTGTVLRVLVASGQTVSQAQPVLELVDLRRLWVRARVPIAESPQIADTEAAEVGLPKGSWKARPVHGAPTADQLSSTIDLYYEVESSSAPLSPDQRVSLSLPLNRAGDHLVVPSAAILYDIHGGAWVYARSQPLEYHRVRVQVDQTLPDGLAVLREGPKPGTSVVVDGAAEIFGIEFGND